MQKRLFWVFFPMMFIPALFAMMIDWHNNQELLAVLDGPGLTNSFDASLTLARQVLDTEKMKAHQNAVQLAASSTMDYKIEPNGSDIDNQISWWTAQRLPGGKWDYVSRSKLGLSDSVFLGKQIDPKNLNPPVRRNSGNGSFLVASAMIEGKPDSWIVIAQPFHAELDTLLDQVALGSSGARQLSLFYSRLLRSNLIVNLGILTVFLLIISLLLSHRLSRYLARPLQELSRGTERVAAGDLSHRVQVDAPAELGLLVTAFNGMTSQLQQGRDDLRRAEQVAAWQGVARRLAHEIKNPLTPITLAMHRIGKKSNDETIVSCVDTVLEEAANLGRLADEFSLYAKLPEPQPQFMDNAQLRQLLESLAQFYLARTRVDYRWLAWSQSFILSVDHGQLRQVLSNLIKNGNEAMEGQGTLTFELDKILEPGKPLSSEHKGGWIRLSITDSGPGLASDPESVFEPYVTSKSTGTG